MGMSLHFEPIEVIKVLTDVDTLEVNSIQGRFILSQQNSPTKELHTFYPLEPGTFQVPVVGEIVMGTEFLGKYFYGQKLNFQNSEIANTKFNISSYSSEPVDNKIGLYFEQPSGSKKLRPHEGDTIIQSRFGSAIRLSSNQSEDFTDGNEGASRKYNESPNIKIIAGINEDNPDISQTYEENLQSELSSVYLTTNESVSFPFKDKFINGIDEPQITIQSDKIVFHGRNEFNVYSDSINLGDDENLENAVLGNKLKEVLEEIVDAIENTDIGAGQATKPFPFLGKLKSKINDKILSKNVKLK